MHSRARAIRAAGGLDAALANGAIPKLVDTTLSEGLVLGLLKQGVAKYLAIFGHGSTDLGEVLRIYEEEGVTRTFNCRNEVAMAHAATALRWQYGEIAAVVTSIGPGALQALAGSLAAASNGVGVYHIYGDETTFGEGYNMQQVPKEEQGLFGQMTAIMGRSYVLHTPEGLRDALRRGSLTVNHPYRAGPFYLLLPLNTQPARLTLNLAALPERPRLAPLAPASDAPFAEAAELIAGARKSGHQGRRRHARPRRGGAPSRRGRRRRCRAVARLHRRAARRTRPEHARRRLQGLHLRQLRDGGSRSADRHRLARRLPGRLLRHRLQVRQHVININGDLADATHYNRTLALVGDISAVAARLSERLERDKAAVGNKREWLAACAAKKSEWAAYKRARFEAPPIRDEVWQRPALAQPAAIKVVADFAKQIGAAKFFDAGDVQANGFQIVEDDKTGDTFTESGASYMGFAVSALLASAIADKPRYGIAFTGDGSFMMNPQILIDGVEHGVRGTIVIFDNRRMAAITGLQVAQYGTGFRTNDRVAVDYVRLAGAVSGVLALHGGWSADELKRALQAAHAHDGLSVVHVPVYAGDHELAGFGAWGQWNVGNWCADVQREWLEQDL